MQKIKTVRWPVRNIGGDRCYVKLRYVNGFQLNMAAASFAAENCCFNVGAAAPGTNLNDASISGRFGTTPGLGVIAQQYQNYRINGIALKMTYWQQSGPPVILFSNAQSDQDGNPTTSSGPTPAFVTPTISQLPEQRWAKYRVCQMTANGGKPTRLSAYYSVNRVQGPDQNVRTDREYTGELNNSTLAWDPSNAPTHGPWLQYGISSLSGLNQDTTGVLKIETTVYMKCWGKRALVQ